MTLRLLTATIFLALVLACAHKDAGKALNKSPERKADAELRSASRAGEDAFLDSSFYIGYVDYFPETHEFYTALFFRDGHEYPDEDLLAARLDSVIVYDDDWGRERLPIEEARNILVLSGLDSLAVYNRDHELICRCPLSRVEYLWNGLENYFIAVFKHADKNFEQTEELYGIGSAYVASGKTSAIEFGDASYDLFLKKKLKLSPSLEWQMRHYRLSSPDRTLSLASAYSMESSEAQSYLILKQGDDVRVLNEEINNFHYLNILPLPLSVNDQPLLLISAGYPSRDVLWDYLAAFQDSTYQPLEYNRIPFREAPAFAAGR